MFDTHDNLYLNSRSCSELVKNAKNVVLKLIINIGINVETSLFVRINFVWSVFVSGFV